MNFYADDTIWEHENCGTECDGTTHYNEYDIESLGQDEIDRLRALEANK